MENHIETDLNIGELISENLRKEIYILELMDLRPNVITNLLNIDFREFYEQEFEQELGQLNDEGWTPTVRCPFHEDTNPSLGVNLIHGGFNCFGCEKKGNLIQFYQSRHEVLEYHALRELAERPGCDWDINILRQNRNQSEPIQAHDYFDSDGNLSYQVCRFENKQFRMKSLDFSGDWHWNMDGVVRIPYNLPSVIAAESVFIVEGEKDADTLIELGLTASCNPMGAGKWKQSYNQYFEGKRIFILPDNDDAGHNHALNVARSLFGMAESIKIVEFPGLSKGGDVSDWLNAGNSLEQLQNVCETANCWNPDSDQLLSTQEQAITTISIKELLSIEYEDLAGVIDNGILPEGGQLIIAGESDVGKSLITLEWAIHFAIGRSIFDGVLPVPKPRKVIFFQSENPHYQVQRRINRILQGMEIADPPKGIYFSNPEYQYNLSDSNCVNRMIRAVEECQAEVCIIDPLSSFHNENENDNTKMRSVLDQVTRISRSRGCAAIVVHHFGKPTEARDESYRVRGASAIKDWCDTMITITTKRHEHRTLRQITFGKLRHGMKPKPILVERDSKTLILTLTEADMMVTPKQVRELLDTQFGGTVNKQRDLVKAIIAKYKCSDKTAKKAIAVANKMELIKTEMIGRQKTIKSIKFRGNKN